MTGSLLCPVCGFHNRLGAQVCEDCGLIIPQYHACQTCGFMNTADSRFCGSCGQPLTYDRPGSAGPKPAPVAPAAPPFAAPPAPPPARSGPLSPQPPGPQLVMKPKPVPPPPPAPGSSFIPQLDRSDAAPRPASPPPVAPAAPRPAAPPPPGNAGVPPAGRPEAGAPASGRIDPLVGRRDPEASPAKAGPAFRLIHEGTGVEIRLPLGDGALTVGRPGGDPDVDISGFPEASVVSRKHARLVVEAGAVSIEDLGSANGTYVNNVRVRSPHALSDGDRIAFGQGAKVVFTVRL